jgi:prepilin-type N-terminal cleavage/methylation domain-containing protein
MSLFWNNKGVTLVELMVVMIVLAIGLLPLAFVQILSQRDVFHSGQRTEALNIAQMQMERAKTLGFQSAVPDSGITGPFSWRTDVQVAGVGLNLVTVTVQWQERGDPRTVTFRNLLSWR